MHQHTKFGIPAKNVEDMHQTLCPILETRSELKVTFTQGCNATLHHPNMQLHDTFVISISNDIRDMLQTRLFSKLGQRSRSQ